MCGLAWMVLDLFKFTTLTCRITDLWEINNDTCNFSHHLYDFRPVKIYFGIHHFQNGIFNWNAFGNTSNNYSRCVKYMTLFRKILKLIMYNLDFWQPHYVQFRFLCEIKDVHYFLRFTNYTQFRFMSNTLFTT